MSNRTVHACYSDMEIVRYDRAGKWYLEPRNSTLSRQQVTIKEAVDQAIWAAKHGGQIFFGLHGGSTFDRLVTASTEQDMSGYEAGGV